ncbi:glutaredoxin domain-containing cysteine-rich protein CG12206-like [Musca vetustissima]|uniref:glutaredoxin domain-containing cysteine-rich protein CG12206-like n=1 Tax=Musca vetustissima TaxID=27455 RepID=UPI002AB6A838|nr:glutaredoxin domain-containing cysteine-rich protein CG12206-like [Musca vetustissima]
MSSGQFSPCDTLDSGTGSDLESQNHTPHTPTAHLLLPPSSSNSKTNSNGLEMHLKTTKVRLSQNGGNKEQRNCNSSSYTDSEESEASSLSCDSLHSNEFMRQSSQSPIQNKIPNGTRKILGSFLPDSLLRDIKNLKLNQTEYEAENENEEDEDHIEQRIKAHKQRNNESSYEPISSQDYMMAQNDYVQTRNTENSAANANSNSSKRASLPSKTFVLNQEDGTFIDMKMNSMPRKYEADKYYNFHVNEHENFRSFGNNSNGANNGFSESGNESLSEYDSRSSLSDDVFAGYKDLRCGSATSTIRSNKGTVRGVKNRVRNGIATFLQLQQPNMKVSGREKNRV